MEIKRNRYVKRRIRYNLCINPSLYECSKITGISYDTLLDIRNKYITFVDSVNENCSSFPKGICPSIEINSRWTMHSRAKMHENNLPKTKNYNLKYRRRIIIELKALVSESIQHLLLIEPKMTFISIIKNLTSILCAMCYEAKLINHQESFVLSLLHSKYSYDEYIKKEDILVLVNQTIKELQLQYMNGYNIKESIYKEIISIDLNSILQDLSNKSLIKINNDEYSLPKKLYISI